MLCRYVIIATKFCGKKKKPNTRLSPTFSLFNQWDKIPSIHLIILEFYSRRDYFSKQKFRAVYNLMIGVLKGASNGS